jgi:hypothetical protein
MINLTRKLFFLITFSLFNVNYCQRVFLIINLYLMTSSSQLQINDICSRFLVHTLKIEKVRLQLLMQLLLTLEQLAHQQSNVWYTIKDFAYELTITHVKNESSLRDYLQTVWTLALFQKKFFSATDFKVADYWIRDTCLVSKLELCNIFMHLSFHLTWYYKENTFSFFTMFI